MNSMVYDHFGSAPMFLIYDDTSKALSTIDNQNVNRVHGMCSPINTLSGQSVDVMILGGIGAGALNKFAAMGVTVLQVGAKTVQENIDLYHSGKLQKRQELV